MRHKVRLTHLETLQLVPHCCKLILCPLVILLQVVMPLLQVPQLASGHPCRAGFPYE